jgi:hypothetical protein
MKEETIVRDNLMNRQGYAPYCGSHKCVYRSPRSVWDGIKNQFTCKCGWVSHFPQDFIIRYKEKWGLK